MVPRCLLVVLGLLSARAQAAQLSLAARPSLEVSVPLSADQLSLPVSTGGGVASAVLRTRQVLWVGEDGRFRLVGREGSGPGEYQRISALSAVADTLWVIDAALQRMTPLLPLGSTGATRFWGVLERAPGAFLLPNPVAKLKEGVLWVSPRIDGALERDTLRTLYLGITRDSLRPIARLRRVSATLSTARGRQGGATPIRIPNPFSPGDLFTAAGGGRLVVVASGTDARNGAVTFSAYDSAARQVWRRTVELPVHKLSTADREGIREQLRGEGMPVSVYEALTGELDRIVAMAPVLQLAGGRGDVVWALRPSGRSEQRWYGLTLDGVPFGELSFGTASHGRALVLEREHVWTIAEGPDGNALLRRFAIQHPGVRRP